LQQFKDKCSIFDVQMYGFVSLIFCAMAGNNMSRYQIFILEITYFYTWYGGIVYFLGIWVRFICGICLAYSLASISRFVDHLLASALSPLLQLTDSDYRLVSSNFLTGWTVGLEKICNM